MKEITTILTVQLTAITKMPDEKAKSWEENKDARIDTFLKGVEEEHELDDLQLLESKTFIRDVEEQHG